MGLSHPWSHDTVSCPFTRALPRVISASVRKTDWLATIHQTRASPALVFRDLEASVASVTQTDPVTPRGSSLSITQRNKRDGSWVLVLTLALMSRVTLPKNFILQVTQFPQLVLLRRVKVTSKFRTFTEDLPCTRLILLIVRKHRAFKAASAFSHSACWRTQTIRHPLHPYPQSCR